jgi:hypothetical protein
MAFKNISEILIDIIENPPSIQQQEPAEQHLSMYNAVEAMIHGETKEGCMN